MKFFHLSDLHIGLKLFNRDLEKDQAFIFKQIAEAAAAEKPDAVIIAGDIYDKAVPSAESVEVFDQFVSQLRAAVPQADLMLISGNHDSGARLNVFRSILQRQRVHMIGMPPQTEKEYIEKVTLEDDYGKVNFYLLPFVRPSMVQQMAGPGETGSHLSYDDALHRLIERETIDPAQRNVLVSHQFYVQTGKTPDQIERMDSELCTVGNIDAVRADVLQQFDYAALGHIHKPMQVGSPAYRYCGTPLACSLSEAGQQKGIVVVDMQQKGKLETRVLPLKPLHEIRRITGTLQEVLELGCGDYAAVTLTDRVDLDVIDMQDRLRRAFPNLLEIRREGLLQAEYGELTVLQENPDVFELCRLFLKDLDEEEQLLLKNVINTVQEVQEG